MREEVLGPFLRAVHLSVLVEVVVDRVCNVAWGAVDTDGGAREGRSTASGASLTGSAREQNKAGFGDRRVSAGPIGGELRADASPHSSSLSS